jgi:glucose-1-phosphate thymidylyltransferase
VGEEFIGEDNVGIGDNIFYGSGLSKLLQRKCNSEVGSSLCL